MTTDRTIEFLFLDTERCGRCGDTEAHLREAVALAAQRLGPGVTLDLRRIHITSAADAASHRVVSSPTIRVDGHDIARALLEAPCESDACACADGTPIDCRMWEWNGALYPAPPVAMLVQAIVAPPHGPPPAQAYVLPQNLARFFAADESACCTPSARESCCEPAAKSACCGPADDVCTCQ